MKKCFMSTYHSSCMVHSFAMVAFKSRSSHTHYLYPLPVQGLLEIIVSFANLQVQNYVGFLCRVWLDMNLGMHLGRSNPYLPSWYRIWSYTQEMSWVFVKVLFKLSLYMFILKGFFCWFVGCHFSSYPSYNNFYLCLGCI
jgi:hypothetical protein